MRLWIMIVIVLMSVTVFAQELQGRVDYCSEVSATGATRQMWQFYDAATNVSVIDVVESFAIPDASTPINLHEQIYMSTTFTYTAMPDAAIRLKSPDFQPDFGASSCQLDFEAIRAGRNPQSNLVSQIEANRNITFSTPGNRLLQEVYDGLVPMPLPDGDWINPRWLPSSTRLGFQATIPFTSLNTTLDHSDLINNFPQDFLDFFQTYYETTMSDWHVEAYPVLEQLNVDLTQNSDSGQKQIFLRFNVNSTDRRLLVEVEADIVDSNNNSALLPAGIGQGDIDTQLREAGYDILHTATGVNNRGIEVIWYMAYKNDTYLLIELKANNEGGYDQYRSINFRSQDVGANFTPEWMQQP